MKTIVQIVKVETRISVVINSVLSAAFFFLAFGLTPRILATAAPDQLALDFIPQSIAIGFFSAFVPTFILGRKSRKSGIWVAGSKADSVKTILLRAFGFALVAGVVGALIAFGLALATVQIGYYPALMIKIIYGGVLAFLVTPRAIMLSFKGAGI